MKRIGRTLAIALSITLMAAAGLAAGRARVARADDHSRPPSTGIAEGDIAILSATRTEFEVGPDQQTTLRLQSTLAVDHAVASVAGSGESFPMYDDGDLGAHGDDIAGDGVYSALYTVDCSREDLGGIEITGTITIGSQSLASEPVALYVVAPFTDAELGLMATVDQAISDVMQGEGFDAKPLPDQAAAVKAVLDRLASSDPGIEGYSSPLIVEGSVEYEEGATAISFQYAIGAGIDGGVLLKNPDPNMKGGDAERRQPGDADRVPAGAEAEVTTSSGASLPAALAVGAALAALAACLLLRLRRGRG
ncbi:MAG: hypothetical protein ACFNLW_06100 [Olsenella sp.]